MRKPGTSLRAALRSLAVLAAFGLGLWILHRELSAFHPRAILAYAAHVPLDRLVAALGFMALSFFILSLYDVLGLRYAAARLPYRRTAFTSMTAFGLSQSLGFTIITGTSVRYRLYTQWGLTTAQVSRALIFYALSFWLGLGIVLGGVLVLEPEAVAAPVRLPPAVIRALGGALWILAGCYVAWCRRRAGSIRIGRLEVTPPPARLAVAQLLIGPLDWVACAAVLYVLLPPGAVPFPLFLGAFVAGHSLGVISHVPAGLGVFEATLVLLLGGRVDAPTLLGAVVVYRGIYYLLPMTVAAIGLAAHEAHRQRARIDAGARRFAALTMPVLPSVVSVATFAAGAFLLISGVFPAEASRVRALVQWIPLSTLELSHVLSSLVGALLILLAWGLRARLDRAFRLTVALLAAGIPLSLLRGLDFDAALALALALLIVVLARKEFFRRASLRSDPPVTEWIVAGGVVLGLAVWLGAEAYRQVPARAGLWLEFTPRGNAARFVRGTAVALASFAVASFAWLLRPAPPHWVRSEEDEARAARIVRSSPRPSAALALLGDKRFLFSSSGETAIMYGVEGRTWVALGDPIGPEAEWEEVLWRFVEETHRYDDHPAFYEVAPKRLNLYAELGLGIFKLGEEARVPLADFTLEGGDRKGLRRVVRAIERDGHSFEVIPAGAVGPLLPELRAVSDEWLATKETAEKGFSLGFFDEDYLRRFPAAIVRRDGRVLAFSNLLEGAGKSELSPDLMRFRSDSPNGIMDYQITRLLLWAREQGYDYLNLGMAPLSGLDERTLAPAWERLGALVYRHGDRLYGFEGLRAYKEKFEPVWEPRYLATRAGLALPRILANVTTLIAGGIGDVFRR